MTELCQQGTVSLARPTSGFFERTYFLRISPISGAPVTPTTVYALLEGLWQAITYGYDLRLAPLPALSRWA